MYKSEWGEETVEIFSDNIMLDLYEGEYTIEIKGQDPNHIIPLFDLVEVNSNLNMTYDVGWAKLLYSGINYDDWVINSGDWYFDQHIFSQSSSYYENNLDFYSMTLSPAFFGADLVALINLKYEFEWDKDYLSISYLNDTNDSVSEIKLSGHKFLDNQSIMLNAQPDENGLKFNISMNTDESLYYRGAIIEDVQILSDSGLDECFYGDVNFDGILNVSDIMKMLNYILGYDALSGYYRCVSDMNGDEIVNIQDVINLIFIILGD